MAEFPAAGSARQPSRAFAWALRGGTAELAQARRAFGTWLTVEGVDPEHRAELSIVLSELAANAIAAGEGSERSPIAMRAWCEGVDVVLEVENALEDDTSGIAVQDEADPLRGTGRGLIVAAYATTVEVVPAEDEIGLTVRCRTLGVA
jgi:anti-sigma regulatory factor (Ser/Thr protein kinase)